MNYGYIPSPDASPLTLDADDEPDRYCIQLYDFVAGACDLAGKHVVEVGSGRGGGASFVKRYLRPAALIGVDFSATAVEFCRHRYRVEGLSFQKGNAEALPFEADSVDAIVNVESSHCYGSIPAFLSEVHRVLKPGGVFLYADLHDSAILETWRAQLLQSGLHLAMETNITPNVLAALDLDHDRKSALIRRLIPRPLLNSFGNFAGLRGSSIYEGFRTGRLTYRAFRLEKPWTH